MTASDFRAQLADRAALAGVTVSPDLSAALDRYYQLLATWNRKINLTGLNLTAPTAEAVDRLFIEPLLAAQHVPTGARRVIDIGSGGGSPAIPFALAAGRLQLLMVESRARKSVFLREALRQVGLTDGAVATERYEELAARREFLDQFDILTIRAVRIEDAALRTLIRFVRPGGLLFLFHGAGARAEVDPAQLPLTAVGSFPLVPAARSELAILRRSAIEQA